MLGVMAGEGAASVRQSGLECVLLRDLAAVVRRVPARRIDATTSAITEFRTHVEQLATDRAIIPAPFGTVFRSRDALVRWMDLHYVTLADGLSFVRGRAAARLLIAATPETSTPDYEAAVFESMRFLKRHAVATVVLPDDSDGKPRTAEVAYLVERERWTAFAAAVREEQERVPSITIEQSGPWPAYDFVRLHFGN